MGLLIRKGETGFLLAFCYRAEYPTLSAIILEEPIKNKLADR